MKTIRANGHIYKINEKGMDVYVEAAEAIIDREQLKEDYINSLDMSFDEAMRKTITIEATDARGWIVMKDGTEISIQASELHHCTPKESGLDEYEEYEICGQVKDIGEEIVYRYGQIEDTFYGVDQEDKIVCDYVPKEVIESIINIHQGIDKFKTLANVVLKGNKNLYELGYIDEETKDYFDEIAKRVKGITKDKKGEHEAENIADSISPRKGEVEEVIEETSQMAKQEETTREEQEGQTQGEE